MLDAWFRAWHLLILLSGGSSTPDDHHQGGEGNASSGASAQQQSKQWFDEHTRQMSATHYTSHSVAPCSKCRGKRAVRMTLAQQSPHHVQRRALQRSPAISLFPDAARFPGLALFIRTRDDTKTIVLRRRRRSYYEDDRFLSSRRRLAQPCSEAIDRPVATVQGARTYSPTEDHFERAKCIVTDGRLVQTL